MNEERSSISSSNIYEEIGALLNNPKLFSDKFDGEEQNDLLAVIPKYKHKNGLERSNSVSQIHEEYGKSENSTGVILVSLIELVCKSHEQDPEKQTQIYKLMIQSLIQYSLVSPLCCSEALAPARRSFQNAFIAQLTKFSTECLPSNGSDSSKRNSLALAKVNGQNVNYNCSLRFLNDFEEICDLGKGGFGQVVKVRCFMDNQFYAVKKINFDPTHSALCYKVLREVRLLAALNHPNIVRFYSTWVEFGPTLALLRDVSGPSSRRRRSSSRRLMEIKEISDESTTNGRSLAKLNSSFSSPNISFVKSQNEKDDDFDFDTKSERNVSDTSSSDSSDTENSNENGSRKNNLLSKSVNKNLRDNYPFAKSLVLYLQMELGSLTLRDWLTDRNGRSNNQRDTFSCIDSSANEHILRQLLKALEYIHSRDIIHRDIKPSNIFLKQPGNHVLLGDFGLATAMDGENFGRKFDDAEDESSTFAVDKWIHTHSVGVGTLSYSSPEQLKSRYYDQKSDMFSVGVIAFELYCPFQTMMERMHSLMELRRGEISEIFQREWPVETVFIKQLIQKNANLRPSAKQVLDSGFFQTKNDLIGALKLQLQEQRLANDRLKQEIERLKSKLVERS